jgi:chitodextrinase
VLTASNIGFTSLTLSWTPAQDNIGAISYKIYQNGTLIIETYEKNIIAFLELTTGTQYTFKVEACDATGNCSTDGPSVNVRTLDDLSAPTWPDGSALTASNIGFTSLTLSWTPAQDNAEVVLYQIYKDGTFLATVPPTFGLTYDVEGLTANTQYTFKVEACDAVSNCSTDGPSLDVGTLTPQEAGQQLITNVNNLVNKGALNEGQGNSLIAKLEAAIQQLDRGNSNASINQLQAFTNEVKAYVKGGVLSSKQGQLLIDAAQKIISVLGS